MKITLLTFILSLTIQVAFAQNPITISSTCETLDYHGTYTYVEDLTGKPRYKKGVDWMEVTNEQTCVGGSFLINSYYIEWDGTKWYINRSNPGNNLSCNWFFNSCVTLNYPFSQDYNATTIATNTANTPLPPCSGWVFSTAPACAPSFSECTTLATNGFVFENNIEIFPNPIENDFTIKLKEVDTDLHVTILNSLGQEIISVAFTNSQEMKLSLNQPTGIYFAKITNKENQVAYFKLMKK